MTFLEKTKRLLGPLYVLPWHFFWNSIEGLGIGGYYVYSFIMLRQIIGAIQQGDQGLFYDSILWYGCISTLLITARFLTYKIGWAQILYDGQSHYYEKYLRYYIQADGNQVEKIGTGRFISIIQKGLNDWLEALWELSLLGSTNIVILSYALYFIFGISFDLGIVTVMLMLIILMVVIPVNIWMREKRFARYEAEKEGYHQATVALMSKNELLQSNTFDIIVQKIQRHFEAAKIANHPLNIGFCVLEEFPRFIFLILRMGTYIFIAKKGFLTGQVDMAELTVFVTMIAVMEKAIVDTFHAIRTFLRHLSGIELLWSTFDSLTPIRGYDSGNTFTPHSPDINISHITYGYNETEIFSDFSLQIASGKKTALVGASGGGKTTLMKLIAGYLHPQSGSISVLGNTLSETALRTYYPHIGYLTQDPGVFDATIRENLISAMSHPPHEKGELERVTQKRKPSNRSNIKGKQNHVTPPSLPFSGEELEQKLIKALKLAQCEFVFELEHGLDTEIGERGVRLSGGQKQRLAIAKIFLKDPEIILLDEPTSALDSFSEEKITTALHTLFEGRTVIIIAHRLQTVKQADDIIVLEGGRVIERGTHETLVETHGVYARMLELQSGF